MKKLLKNNKKIITMILMITLLLWTIAGVSFAAYNFINDAEDNAMNLGQVSMTYTEPSNEVVLKDALPKKDDLGKNQEEYFEFSVMSHATTNTDDDNGIVIPYEISISKVEVDASKKELEDNQVKVYLTRLDGASEIDVVNPTLVSSLKQSDYDNNGYKVYDGSDEHSNNNGSITTKYRIRFWVDENVDVSNWATTNEYEYKFKVNVNAKAEKNTSITLSKAIKSMYTLDNGNAKEEDGYYYLTGMEELDDMTNEQRVLNLIGSLTSVYYYRRADGTFDQEQLDTDIKNYMIASGEVSAEEYEQVTGPFGGYVNVMVGALAGVVDMDNIAYVEGKTIDDIPTLDEAMADEDMKTSVYEMFMDVISTTSALYIDTFQKIYSDGTKINEELLNENLELGAIAAGASDMLSIINTNFGNLTNYAVAYSYEMVDSDTMALKEGLTIDDIPTMDELLLNYTGPLLITNNYVRLNNLLYEVIGINEDNSVKLLLVDEIFTLATNRYGIEQADYSQYLGIGEKNEAASPYLKLQKDTTLSEIIKKRDYKYLEDNEEKYINSYVSLLTEEELMKSSTNLKQSYMLNQYDNYYNRPIAKYAEGQTFYLYQWTIRNNYSNYYGDMYLIPIITIEDIKVDGKGTYLEPYYIKDEKIVSDLNVAESIYMSLKHTIEKNPNYKSSYIGTSLNWNFASTSTTYLKDTIEHFEKYNLDLTNSNMNYTSNGNLFLGLNINGVCFYTDSYGEIYKSEDTGNCLPKEEKELSINASATEIYLNNEEITLTAEKIEGNNITYNWQYSEDGYEWFTLKEGKNEFKDYFRVTATGTNTQELKVIPNASNYNYMYFRYVINNNIYSAKMTVNFKNAEVSNITWSPDTNILYYGDKLTIEGDSLGASDIIFRGYDEQEIIELGQHHGKIEITIDERFSKGVDSYYIIFKGPHSIYTYTQFKNLTIKGPEIVTQPENVELGIGKTATFSVEAKGTLYYSWQQKIGDEWIDLEDIENKVSGSKTSTLQVVATQEMNAEINYRCVLKSKEEIYTNEVKMTIVEADEDWMYTKIADSDGIPTGDYEVVKFIGDYHNSDSVVVKENHFNVDYINETFKIDVSSYPLALSNYVVISPEVFINVIEQEYGIARENITYDHIKKLRNDSMSSEKTNKDIDWAKYTEGYIDGYDITLPTEYKGLKVIGTKKILFASIESFTTGYETIVNDCITDNKCNEISSTLVTDITVPDGYEYIGNYYATEEEFENIYSDVGASFISNNVPFFGTYMVEKIDLASTIKTLGSYSLDGIGMYSTYFSGKVMNIELPSSLKNLSYATTGEYYSGIFNISFQENSVIKNIPSKAFHRFTVGLEIPASVETIGTRIVPFINDESQTTSLSVLTIENTAERPSHLRTIGYQAFYGSTIKQLEIPASVETIEGEAFASVSVLDAGFNVDQTKRYLETLTFEDTQDRPSQLKSVASNAFAYNLPDGVVFPNGIVYGG